MCPARTLSKANGQTMARFNFLHWLSKASLLALGFAAGSGTATAQTACTPSAGYTNCVYYTNVTTGANPSGVWQPPPGVTSVHVQAWGSGGGANANAAANGVHGGGGGYATGTITGLVAGQWLMIAVGGVQGNSANIGSWGGGMAGVFWKPPTPFSLAGVTQANALVIAGGGGGAGATASGGAGATASGGAGGGGNGANDASENVGGGGGISSGPGASGDTAGGHANTPGYASDGMAFNGGAGGSHGDSSNDCGAGTYSSNAEVFNWGGVPGTLGCNGTGGGGGGGGAGYFGGGGGSGSAGAGAGGGGGSSYLAANVTGGSLVPGNGAAPGNTTSPQYIAGIGTGSTNFSMSAQTGFAGFGMVVLQWTVPPLVYLSKTSYNGFGPFPFTVSGATASNPASPATANGETITTTASGSTGSTPGANTYVGTAGTAVTITETLPTGWANANVSMVCTDTNAASDGNLNISPLTLDAGEIPAAAMVNGANWICEVTNTGQLPSVSVSLVTTGAAGGPFTLSVAGSGSTTTTNSLTTTAANSPVSGSNMFTGTAGTDATVSVTNSPMGFSTTPSSIVCTDANASSDGIGSASPVTLSGGTLTAASMVLGSAWSCVVVTKPVPYCVAHPSVAVAGNAVTITCSNVPAGGTVTIPGTSCSATNAGGVASCTGTAGTADTQVNSNPIATIVDAANPPSSTAVAVVFSVVSAVASIPTLGDYALALLTLMLGGLAAVQMRRTRKN